MPAWKRALLPLTSRNLQHERHEISLEDTRLEPESSSARRPICHSSPIGLDNQSTKSRQTLQNVADVWSEITALEPPDSFDKADHHSHTKRILGRLRRRIHQIGQKTPQHASTEHTDALGDPAHHLVFSIAPTDISDKGTDVSSEVRNTLRMLNSHGSSVQEIVQLNALGEMAQTLPQKSSLQFELPKGSKGKDSVINDFGWPDWGFYECLPSTSTSAGSSLNLSNLSNTTVSFRAIRSSSCTDKGKDKVATAESSSIPSSERTITRNLSHQRSQSFGGGQSSSVGSERADDCWLRAIDFDCRLNKTWPDIDHEEADHILAQELQNAEQEQYDRALAQKLQDAEQEQAEWSRHKHHDIEQARADWILAKELQDAEDVLAISMPKERTCVCCCDLKHPLEFPAKPPTVQCDHASDICLDCLQTWVASELNTKGCDGLNCPQCRTDLEFDDVRRGATPETFAAFENLLTRKALSALPEFSWCLAPHCGSGQLNSENSNFMKCIKCNHEQCLKHQSPWHADETCEQHDYRMSGQQSRDEQRKTEAMIDTVSKKCPGRNCGWRIQKTEGCDHMRCRNCNFEFCWLCLASHLEIKRIGNTAHEKWCKYHSKNLTPDYPFNVH